ncbi:hypothetical protein D3C80_1139600 [compost metagenome]
MESYNQNLEFEKFISFIRNEIGEFNLEISENTLIEDNLGVTGAEAEELIYNFSKQYEVDISTFNPKLYFYPEPSLFSKHTKILPLTVGDLFKAISKKKLE